MRSSNIALALSLQENHTSCKVLKSITLTHLDSGGAIMRGHFAWSRRPRALPPAPQWARATRSISCDDGDDLTLGPPRRVRRRSRRRPQLARQLDLLPAGTTRHLPLLVDRSQRRPDDQHHHRARARGRPPSPSSKRGRRDGARTIIAATLGRPA